MITNLSILSGEMTQGGAGHQKEEPCDNENRAMSQSNCGERKLEVATGHSLMLSHPDLMMPQERLWTLCPMQHRLEEHVGMTGGCDSTRTEHSN